MLKDLHIENIAVIESADISFSPGLNVFSGESSSGKSLVIDSINAVLGNRTSRELVRHGADSALVTASFESDYANNWLNDNDIPVCDELILQRKISSEGKSGCRINGMPVTALQMRELASMLVDIHGQNDGMRLLDEKSHLSFLDSFDAKPEAYNAFKASFVRLAALVKEIKSVSMDESEKIRLSDSLKYTIEEIEKHRLRSGEYDELIAKRDMLRNSEKLKEALDSALQFLTDKEENAVSMTENAEFFASKAAAVSQELEESAALLKEASSNLSQAAELLSDARDTLNFSDDEYDSMESRISAINRLSKKYGLDEDGLIKHVDQCRAKLQDIEYSDERLAKLKAEFVPLKEECTRLASALSEQRKAAASRLEKRIVEELTDLNMRSVRFKVDFSPVENSYGFDRSGGDVVRFLMSANAGEEPERISKIASGGELSRIMLAMKNVFAENDIVDTLIFDEIDSGVSGIAAQRVAEKLYNVSKDRQVMCVSHLPQIAAMADAGYLVEKEESNGKTYTRVTLLDGEGRKREIARMYGGDNISETTIKAASEQLNSAEEYKSNVKR